ncbi:MAG: branched-chain alpha-keto acid dehydrogenase subunit E2, partial [Comamonadaceae bacterium]
AAPPAPPCTRASAPAPAAGAPAGRPAPPRWRSPLRSGPARRAATATSAGPPRAAR